jgi:hypothetical protein
MKELTANLHRELPPGIELMIAEIRARAEATIAGKAPATLPAPPKLEIVAPEPESPTISIFSLESLSWLDKGVRAGCAPFQIVALPIEAGKIAMERGLAIEPNSPRYVAMREEAKRTGWPHLTDAQKVYDLDRDPSTTSVYSSGGRKLRDEQTFTQMDRGPPRKASWVNPAPEK